MSFYKIKPGDLIKGAAIDWSKVANGAQQPLTQDEVTMDKYDTNGEMINIGKKPAIPSRTMPKRDVPTGLDMPVRSADGSAQIWRPSRVTTEAERQHAADTAKRVGDAAASWVGSDAGKSAVQAVGNQVGATTAATAINYPTVNSYDRMLEFLGKQQQIDADRDKRARRREMMAAIGDGISAVSSLYQTTKGAPVTYTPGADMSKVMRDRYDRMVAQRKADSDKYLNYLKVQNAKEQADELREYKRTNQEIRREELERQKKNDKAREDYRNMGLRLRDLERQRKIANSPGGDVYFKTLQDMIAEGYSEEEAENEAMKELAAYNTQHGTNYTIVDKRDNSGRVSRTVTVKTNDQQTAGQVEQVANSNVDNAPAPKSKRSGKGGSTSKKSSTKKPKAY